MVQVRLRCSRTKPGGVDHPGDVIDVTEYEARRLLQRGSAEPVQSGLQFADKDPQTETATKTRRRRRKDTQ
jgi:hypothetical protein